MAARKPQRQRSGGARLLASGRRPVTLGVEPSDHDTLRKAAQLDRRPITQFLIHYGLVAAKKILEKSGESS
jgi:uncharacterized protein (DUF1778 family)